MTFLTLATSVLIFYGILWFFDSFFKSCMHYPYYAFLEGTGLKISYFHFSWNTSAFNRPIYRWGKKLSRFLGKWFYYGFLITLLFAGPMALLTLIQAILQQLYSKIVPNGNNVELIAVLPGVNVPVTDTWLYITALALTSMVHELGHALAAVVEDVQILSLGFHVILIMPVAYVKLNTEHLNSLHVVKRLKIVCAGVWHNIVLAIIAVVLHFLLPILFSIAYESDIGVRITDFTKDSPLKTVRGLEIDDVILSVNNCKVKNYNDWNQCLHKAYNRYGICTKGEFIAQHDESKIDFVKENDVIECCRKEDLFSFCFEYMEPKNDEMTLGSQYTCLRPRDMVKNEYSMCTEDRNFYCQGDSHCLQPCLGNQTYLIIIERKDNNPVLYLGLPYDVHKTVKVDQYFPRLSVLSIISPSQIVRLLEYIFVFSVGLAFLNILPCYGTDGHVIANNLIQILANFLNKNDNFVAACSLIVVVIGTGLTVPTILYVFYKTISIS